jgi:hypothetical protein
MALNEDQVHLVGTGRDLLMGEGTRFDVQSDFNPFMTQIRTPQSHDRPYAHGALVGAEWFTERVVPIRVIANGAAKTVPSARAAVQDMSAAFAAVGATGEIAELHFRLAEDPDEFVLFGRPRGIEPDMGNLGLGYAYVSTAFVASDPRIYSGLLTSQSTGLPLQQGGLTLPAVAASTRLRLLDVAGTYASTPNHASLQITGDFSLRIGLDLRSWTDGFQQLVTRYGSAGAISYALNVDSSGIPRIQWSADGTTVLTAPASQGLAGVSRMLWLRGDLDVNNGAAGRTATFYTGPTRSGPWTALGSPVIQAGVTSVFAGPSGAPLEVGSRGGGLTQTIRGAVYGAEVRNSAGTVVADPDFTVQQVGATGFTDSTGKTWSVNGSAKLVANTYRGGLTVPATVPGVLTGGVLTLTNSGTTDTSLRVRIDGPAIEPRLVLRRPDGTVQTLSFDLDLADGQWLDINTISGTALLNGLAGSNQRGVATWLMDPYPVQPGENTLRFASADYNTTAQLTAEHRSAWW